MGTRVFESVLIATAFAVLLQILLLQVNEKFRRPKYVLVCFVAVYVLMLGMHWRTWSVIQILHFSLFYGGAFGTALMTYINTLEFGPSFLVLLHIKRKGSVSEEELARLIERENLLRQRMQEMLKGKTVTLQGDRYTITEHGRRYLWFFTFYRRLLGLSRRGG